MRVARYSSTEPGCQPLPNSSGSLSRRLGGALLNGVTRQVAQVVSDVFFTGRDSTPKGGGRRRPGVTKRFRSAGVATHSLR